MDRPRIPRLRRKPPTLQPAHRRPRRQTMGYPRGMARDRAVGVWECRGDAGGEDAEACGGEGEGLWTALSLAFTVYQIILGMDDIYTGMVYTIDLEK